MGVSKLGVLSLQFLLPVRDAFGRPVFRRMKVSRLLPRHGFAVHLQTAPAMTFYATVVIFVRIRGRHGVPVPRIFAMSPYGLLSLSPVPMAGPVRPRTLSCTVPVSRSGHLSASVHDTSCASLIARFYGFWAAGRRFLFPVEPHGRYAVGCEPPG